MKISQNGLFRILDRAIAVYWDNIKEKRKIKEQLRLALVKENISEVKSLLAMYRSVFDADQYNNAIIWIEKREGKLIETEGVELEP